MAEHFAKLQENQRLLQSIPYEKHKPLISERLEKVIQHLGSFPQCPECNKDVTELNETIEGVIDQGQLGVDEAKQLNAVINTILAHLEKEHELLPEGHYISIYLPLGLSLGVAFGLTLLDNIGMGIALGLSLGVAIGASLDADAKKKGKVL